MEKAKIMEQLSLIMEEIQSLKGPEDYNVMYDWTGDVGSYEDPLGTYILTDATTAAQAPATPLVPMDAPASVPLDECTVDGKPVEAPIPTYKSRKFKGLLFIGVALAIAIVVVLNLPNILGL